MPVEQDENELLEQAAPTYEQEIAQIKALWQELPEAHQVALALTLVGSILEGPYRPYFRHAMTQQWPIRPTEFPVAFPKFELTDDDLLNAYLDEEDLVQLTPEHLREMAETMRSHYINDLFLPELRHIAGLLLENLGQASEPETTTI